MIVARLFLPGNQRAGQPIDLGHVNFSGPGVELFQPLAGGFEVGGGVHGAEEFFGYPGAGHLTAPEPVEDAFGTIAASLVKIVVETNRQITDLQATLGDRLRKHPDADIYPSMPGLGAVLSARALAEFGDDPDRYTSAKSPRNYAGTSPITVASGRKHTVMARHVPNKRLYDAPDLWAFCSLQNSPGGREFYDQRKAAGDEHHQALRALANRLVGVLHGCLKHRTPYDEHTAWAHRTALDRAAA